MLDKSIEYKNIIMRIDDKKILAYDEPLLPDNFKFRNFRDENDIKHWARIEASVSEFTSEKEAEEYFISSYYPFLKDLKERCFFITNKDDLPVATATAWFSDSELGHQASLHWVAVCPEYQGLGLGKAATRKALCAFKKLEPHNHVWLHTQTWSYVAVMLYCKMGFNILKTEKLANTNPKDGKKRIYPNDFDEAINVLKKALKEKDLKELINSAV